MRVWVACLWLTGCWLPDSAVRAKINDLPGRPDTPEDTVDTDMTAETVPIDTPPPDTDVPIDTTPPEDTDLPACWDEVVPSGATGLTLAGNNTDQGDDLNGSCTPVPGGLDLAWSWEVPQDGCYVFSTFGSTFDSVLYLLDGCQDEISCNDDVARELQEYSSEVHAELLRDQVVTIVVDGYQPEAIGDVSLSFWQGDVIPFDLDAGYLDGVLFDGSNAGQDTTLQFSDVTGCEDDGGRDVIVRWQAAQSGVWRFAIAHAEMDTVLSVHRPCDTVAFRCEDVPMPLLGGGQEEIEMTLDLGEVVLLRVAGAPRLITGAAATGSFELRASYVEP